MPILWTMLASALVLAQNQPHGAPGQLTTATVDGTVTDPSGSAIAGSFVALESSAGFQRIAIASETGSFSFSGVRPGTYRVAVTATGFIPFTADNVTVSSAEAYPSIAAVLQLAPAVTQVTVSLPQRELAAAQVEAATKQRLVGLFPNYFVSYEANPVPLTAAQKFELGAKSVFDPAPILTAAISAGVQQARNSYPDYGQGVSGYAKHFAANYGDRVAGVLVGRVLMQALFHQDPRYFYKGTGSFHSRALYAVANAFIRKGDNGHWQPAYSDVLGGMASYGISTLYRPGTSRPGLRLYHTVLLNLAGNAAGNLAQEFLARKITTNTPKTLPSSGPILRAGTPVLLISVDDLDAKKPVDAGPIAFVLAGDLLVDGVTVVKAGLQIWGQATYGAAGAADAEAIHIGLERVRLTIGKADVPLRSTRVRGDPGIVQYHRVENSGRIAVELYVDKDTVLPSGQ